MDEITGWRYVDLKRILGDQKYIAWVSHRQIPSWELSENAKLRYVIMREKLGLALTLALS